MLSGGGIVIACFKTLCFLIQDLKINITRVNIPWQKSDYEPVSHHKSRIHFDCTAEDMELIKTQFGGSIEFMKDSGKLHEINIASPWYIL